MSMKTVAAVAMAAFCVCGARGAEEVARFGFEECTGSYADDSVSGRTAKLTESARWAHGTFGGALATGAQGASAYVKGLDALDGADACTLFIRFRKESAGFGKYPNVLTSGEWVGRGGVMLFATGGESLRFRLRAGGGKGPETSARVFDRVPERKWCSVAVVFARPEVTVYTNGSVAAKMKWDHPFTMGGSLQIGGWMESSFGGFIDDFRAWKGALGAAEIAALAGDSRYDEIEGYQDDGTGGVKKTVLLGQGGQPLATLDGDVATITFDTQGCVASIREKATGRELVTNVTPFVEVLLADGRRIGPRRLVRRGDGRFAFLFGKDGEAEISVARFDGGWIFTVERCTVKDVKTFELCRVKPACRTWVGNFVNAWSDERSAVCVRSCDIKGDPRANGTLRVEVTAPFAPEGRKAALAAGPRDGFRGQLKAMTLAAGAPHSTSGGAWAMDSDVGRRSYFFFSPYPWNLEWGLALARLGGFCNLHFGGWAETLGHNDPSPRQFPGGLEDMRDYVRKIHDAGIYAGIHTLTACISNHDKWIRPLCSTNLFAMYTYTLAEPFTDASDEVRVNEEPGPKHSLIATYTTNGNYLRFGNELMQYSGIRRTKPYAFTGIKRGALGTTRGGPYPAGMRVDYPRNHYVAFYPDADSPLADELAERLGRVFRTCKLDEFYFDGSEGMYTRYGTDAMRHKIFKELVKGASPDAEGPSIEASCGNANNWWFQTRMATTDHGVWGVKRFHDWHVASAIRSSRMANFLEPQMGWWQPRLAVKGKVPGHYVDEMEYFASQNAGHDAAMSIQGVYKSPAPFAQRRQLTVLGWYERARLARAFNGDARTAMAVPGAEFRLRQGENGEWNLTPSDCSYHRADHASLMKWAGSAGFQTGGGTSSGGRTAAGAAALRVEALFAVKPYEAAEMTVLAASDAAEMKTDAASGVKASAGTGADKDHGATIRLSAANTSAPAKGAWARTRKFIASPYLDIGKASAYGFWVKGDGSGALLNFVCRGAQEYHGGTSDHYVRLDFKGWRYFTVAMREREGYASVDYVWPYSGAIHDRLRTIVNTKHMQEFSIYLNDIAPGASASVEVSEVRALETYPEVATGLALVVNGTRHELPFALESGEFAELEGCVWTRYSEMGDPVERATVKSPVSLKAGRNEFELKGAFKGGAPLRVQTALFALGKPFRAFVDALTPEMRRAMAFEAMASVVYAPAKGFDGKVTVAVRPGEEASLSVEVVGPVKRPALGWTRGGERGSVTFETDVAAEQMLLCENGSDWKVVNAKDWSVVAEGRLAQPLPRFAGTTAVEVSSADPASASAIVNLMKKYAPAATGGTKCRFLAFNIWGDFFGNPVHERDLQQLAIVKGHDPDIVGLQEVTPNFWKSRLISGLSSAGYECIGAEMGPNDKHRVAANPVFFRRSRFELVEKGSTWFHPELDYSKGVVWAVLREKATGRKIVAFASHFWWQEKGEADAYLRLLNARMLHGTVAEVAKRHGAAVVGGGDLNSPVTSSALKELKKLGWCDAQEKAPETDPRATWRDFPERDAKGVYRGVAPEKAKKRMWLDHVFYTPESVKPLKFSMDRTQQALDVSDHSPVIFDFEM